MGTGRTTDLRQRGNSEAQKLPQLAIHGLRKVTQRQMWFNFMATKTPPEKTDLQFDTGLPSLWKTFIPQQQCSTVPPVPTIPDAPPAPAEASGYDPILGECSHAPGIVSKPRYLQVEAVGDDWRPMLSWLFTGPPEINEGDSSGGYWTWIYSIHDSFQKFFGPLSIFDNYEREMVLVRKILLINCKLGIFAFSPASENIKLSLQCQRTCWHPYPTRSNSASFYQWIPPVG